MPFIYLSQPIGIAVFRVIQLLLEYRSYYFIYNLIEVLLLDATKATRNISLNVTSENLTLYEAGLGKRVTLNHLVCQRIGVLRIEPVVGGDEYKVKHAVLVLLQLVV